MKFRHRLAEVAENRREPFGRMAERLAGAAEFFAVHPADDVDILARERRSGRQGHEIAAVKSWDWGRDMEPARLQRRHPLQFGSQCAIVVVAGTMQPKGGGRAVCQADPEHRVLAEFQEFRRLVGQPPMAKCLLRSSMEGSHRQSDAVLVHRAAHRPAAELP
ncbi:hypothetical protein AB7M37_005388 [Sinorhizobium fredii]